MTPSKLDNTPQLFQSSFEAILNLDHPILQGLCRQNNNMLLEGNLAKDHVHMVLSVPPKYSIAMTIGFLKGKSAICINRMLDRHQGNLFGRSFWSRGYNVSTVGLDLDWPIIVLIIFLYTDCTILYKSFGL